MKRKLTSIVFILVLCVLVICAFAGCKKTHSHDYGDWIVTLEPTCESAGEKTRTCSGCCEKAEVETIPALGHTYGELVAEKSATCTVDGVKAHYECSVCHKLFDSSKNEIEDLTISAEGHQFGEWIDEVKATCTAEGVRGHYECSVCHKYFDESHEELIDLVLVPGHNYGEWVDEVKATCTADGVKAHYHCSVCEKDFDQDKNELTDLTIAKIDHTYGEWIAEVSATCIAEGTKGHFECSVCHKLFDNDKKELTDLTIGKVDHDYGDLVAEVPATCTEDGVIAHYECSVCHKLFDSSKNAVKDLTITAEGHKLGEWIDEVPATCTVDGVKGHFECSVCHKNFDAEKNQIDSLTISSTGHTFGELVAEVPATCTADGVKAHYHCSVCEKDFDQDNNELTDLTIAKIDHTYGEWIDEVPATCIAEGTKGHYECSVCHKLFDNEKNELSDLTIGKVDHDYGNLVAEVPATCTDDGVKAHYECSVCHKLFDSSKNAVEDLTISAEGHKLGEWIAEVKPTCTDSGAKGHYECSACHKNFDADHNEIKNLTISSTGHTYGNLVAEVPATCTEEGRKAHKHCSACDKEFDVFGNELSDESSFVLSPKGHDFGSWIAEVPATCLDNGIIGHYHCDRCEKDYDAENNELDSCLSAPSGHVYTTETIIPQIDATCEDDGFMAHFECGTCKLYFDESGNELGNISLPKTGHNYGSVEGRLEPTCTESGREDYCICSTCSKHFRLSDYYTTVTDDDLYLAPLGHNYSHYDKTEATCDQNGIEEHYLCDRCYTYLDAENNEVEYATLIISCEGHTYGELIVGIPATETENGYISHYECTKCGHCVDEHKYDVTTIVLPKLEHSFGEWVNEVPATCYENGIKEHYQCTICSKYFDKDYQEIEDISIPAHHSFGKLNPVTQGKCHEPDVVVAYYECSYCGGKFNEQNEALSYDDIFKYNYHHNYEYTLTSDWDHKIACKDCGDYHYEPHQKTYVYFVENGVKMRKIVCSVCEYEETAEPYVPIIGSRVVYDYYVGFSNEYSTIVEVQYEDGSLSYLSLSALMDYETQNELNNYLSSLSEDFTPFVRSFDFEHEGYEGTAEVTFRPFVIKAIKTSYPYYQKGNIYDISDIEFVLDCNYTDDTLEIVNAYGSIIDNGGFDPNYDFETAGEITKIFTIRYEYNGKTYDVEINFGIESRPARIELAGGETINQGEKLRFNLITSDYNYIEFTLDEAEIIEGTFDSSVLGKQTFVIRKEGIVKLVTVYVMDPAGIRYMNVDDPDINIGEKLMLRVEYNNGGRDIIEVTPEMITGTFDNMTAGEYSINIVYKGSRLDVFITVKDPSDVRIKDISMQDSAYFVWNVVDGAIVPNYDYMYIRVNKYNGEVELVRVTEDMVSYVQSEVDEAIASEGNSFRAFVTYYGKTTDFFVTPIDFDAYNPSILYIYKSEDPSNGYVNTLYMQDGDLSGYFVKLMSPNGVRYIPLTKDMFYTIEDENVQFDFETAQNNKSYDVYVRYRDARNNVQLLIYTESDIEYYVSTNGSLSAFTGTKESVLEQIRNSKFSLSMQVCHYNTWICDFRLDDIVLDSIDSIDFSKPGRLTIQASYNGVVFEIYLRLLENMEGVEKTTYTFRDDDLDLYVTGNVYVGYYDEWGVAECVNQEMGLYRISLYEYETFYIIITGTTAEEFRAYQLGENEVVYTFENVDGTNTFKVYTKNGFSMADRYDADFDICETSLVEFSADGKYIIIEKIKYTVKAENKLEIEPEGEVLYRYYMEDEDYFARVLFNDNGKGYLYSGLLNEDGSVLKEVLSTTFTWSETDGIVSAYQNGLLMFTGKIINGEFVIDEQYA